MPDDPNKRGKADRSRVSKQPHEQSYQKQKSKGAPKKSANTELSTSYSAGGLLKNTWLGSTQDPSNPGLFSCRVICCRDPAYSLPISGQRSFGEVPRWDAKQGPYSWQDASLP